MLKVEHIQTYGWEAAVRGMRNPMNSWALSDSGYGCLPPKPELCHGDCGDWCTGFGYIIGENDFDLMKKLTAAGTDHSKFLRMIGVTVDLTAPLYWWKEYDTYKVGTVANSCSTMHKIQDKAFTREDFSIEHLKKASRDAMDVVISALNLWRDFYIGKYDEPGAKDNLKGDKEVWWQMIQLLPSSYNQKRTALLNYAVLRNIYHARKNHKLDEWHTFCAWVESLPYSELITM